MKRAFTCLLIILGISCAMPLKAASSLEAHAAREELLDFIKTTQSRLRDMEQALQSQQRRITQLEDDNRNLRTELAKVGRVNPAAGLEQDIKSLERALQEVDRKRIADANAVDDKLAKVERIVSNMGQSTRTRRQSTRTTPPAQPQSTTPRISPTAKTFEYEVVAGDYLVKILTKLKDQNGVSVPQKAVEEANPGVDWKRLQVGQKLIIPVEN